MEKIPAESGPWIIGVSATVQVLPRVGRMENPRDFSSGGEPDVGITMNCDAASAGRKCAFTLYCQRKCGGWYCLPTFTTIFGCDQFESELARAIGYWVTDRDAMIVIPEGHTIEKAFRILVGKLHSPVFASINGLVDPRLLAWTSAQQVGDVSAESLDIAEVKRLRAWDLSCAPGTSTIRAAEIGSVSAARPDNLVVHRADAAKIFRSVRFADSRILGQKSTGKKQHDAEKKTSEIGCGKPGIHG